MMELPLLRFLIIPNIRSSLGFVILLTSHVILKIYGMHVQSSTQVISKLSDQQANGQRLEHRLIFKPFIDGKSGVEKIRLRLSRQQPTNHSPSRGLLSPQKPKSRLSREDTYNEVPAMNTTKEPLNSKTSAGLHDKRLSELSKNELQSICFPSRWGQSSSFPGKYGEDHRRELHKLRNTLESINSAKNAWNENKIWKTLLENKEDFSVYRRRSRGEYIRPISQRVATNQETLMRQLRRVKEAGFKITLQEQELSEKIASFSFQAKQAIELSPDEKKLLEEIARRTVAIRRQEQAVDLLRSFKKFQQEDKLGRNNHEDLDLIVRALQDLGAEEREGQFWTEYDVALIRALESESKNLRKGESNLNKIAKNLRNQKAYVVLKSKDYIRPLNMKEIRFREKVKKNTGYYRRIHPHEVIELLTKPETQEVKRLAKQYYWMREQLWTPTNSELIERARKELETDHGLSVVEMPIQTLRKVQEKKRIENSVESTGINAVQSANNEEVLSKMPLSSRVKILGLALRKIPVTASGESAFENMARQENLMKACQERVKDQELALRLIQNIKLEELDEPEWQKLQYLFPHELEGIAHLIKIPSQDDPSKVVFDQILSLIQTASDRINLSKHMPFNNHPGHFLLMEAESESLTKLITR
ncbi:hypothetical protein PGT21_024623 [Puccinia graminis f. sp. tritici]|uniref:Uncharacterized protein n=1 Tax=Puccinia graminis f. sp. tritici TaxID=56615 RepID=A0A5B0MXL4_PUCGR|nr:hypothetical protein PGT21_024623 [Puccinia graminis f. sp. tritici]